MSDLEKQIKQGSILRPTGLVGQCAYTLIHTVGLARCENSEGDDKTVAWLYKVRTGSSSDRVVSEMLDYPYHYKIWPYCHSTSNRCN
jgi:hypothetical protein